MFKRPAFFALVASAVVGVAALVSTAADASPHGGRGGGGHHRVIGHGGHGGHVRPGLVRHPGTIRHNIHGHGRHLHLRPHLHPRRHVHVHFRHHSHGHHRHPCFWRHGHHFHWRHCHRHHAHWHWRTHWVGTNYVRSYPVARPVAASCTCLRKTYLPNGAVLFEDVCTNESAVNPPAQAAEVPVPQK